ncbi:syndecan-1-like [Hypanus sabinus]|uniref:syndecan-1-like n=1 Tax=Hypanus sabinus TaxID=79690 RepID=UPI0028C50363|nr:syndecan-1-like [Hypanus sabinus]
MKMSRFSHKFLLTLVFATVVLAVHSTEWPKSSSSNELEASGSYTEDDEDDSFYSGSGSGSGSGDGFMLENSYFAAEYTKTIPSTAPSSSHYSSQKPVTEISSQDVLKDLSTVQVHPDVLVFNTTADTTLTTTPTSSTTVLKNSDEHVSEFTTNNFLPKGANANYDTTATVTQMHSASQMHTTRSNIAPRILVHTAAVVKGESFTVPSVIAANEITTTGPTEDNITEEDTTIIADLNSEDAMNEYFDNGTADRIIDETINRVEAILVNQPNEQLSHENSTPQSFLERRELLAGAVAGGFVGLMIAVLLIVALVYRMKKKDEGSYTLDESKQPNGGYQKPQKQEEFYA